MQDEIPLYWAIMQDLNVYQLAINYLATFNYDLALHQYNNSILAIFIVLKCINDAVDNILQDNGDQTVCPLSKRSSSTFQKYYQIENNAIVTLCVEVYK